MSEMKTSGAWEEIGESEEQLFVESKTEMGLIQLRQDKVKNRFAIRASIGGENVIKRGMTLAEALNAIEELKK